MNTNEIIIKLKQNPERNINMINFIRNYGIDFSYIEDNSIMIVGTSDKDWVYIDVETKSDFDKLSNELRKFSNFAVFNDNQLQWIKEKMNIEIIMSCNKYIFPKDYIIENNFDSISVIDSSYSQYIFDNYEYKEYINLKYIQQQMKNSLVLGIFVGDLLVAWTMTHDDGAMGFLTVLPKYRNKGYATLLSRAYIKHLRDKNQIPFIHIEEHNIKSINLANKSGFQYYEKVHWIRQK